MKIAICSYSGYGLWFALRLESEGHDVDYYLDGRQTQNVLKNIAPPPIFRQCPYQDYDLVLFDLTGRENEAETSSSLAPTLGDGQLAKELEESRLFGIEVMQESDINIPDYEAFDDVNEAKRFIKKTGKKYVFKPDGGQEQETASTYVSKGPDDLLEYLDKLSKESKGVNFILQEVVEGGTEVSTEAWFNGEDFYLINSTLEEKKFMNDGLGPNTGCAGACVWVYDQPPAIFNEGLGRLKDFLMQSNYRGMIDLNTIVTGGKLYGLEWTPRLGYDAACNLFALISSDLGNFLSAIATGSIPTYQINKNFSASIRISIPPYPTEAAGEYRTSVPIKGIDLENEDAIARYFYLYDAQMNKRSGELETAGVTGFIGCPISTAMTIADAFDGVDSQIKKLTIPDLQYRTDIKDKVLKRYEILGKQGWLR